MEKQGKRRKDARDTKRQRLQRNDKVIFKLVIGIKLQTNSTLSVLSL